jgi:hypothetical protein
VSVGLLGGLLLAVSLVSVLTYMVALGQLLSGPRRPGLVRTGFCRLAAALLYVGVGLLTLHTHTQGPLVGLGVFTIVQIMWQANSVADVRLARRSRREAMSDPFDGLGVTDPVPNYATPMPAEVVAAEIDRLSSDLGKVKRAVESLNQAKVAVTNAQRYAVGALALAMVLGLTGVIFGLVVFNRADSAVALANQNAIIIQQLKDTQTQLAKSIHGQCSTYGLLIGTYNVKSRATYAQGGETAYDDAFRNMLAEANALNCGIPTPKDLPK